MRPGALSRTAPGHDPGLIVDDHPAVRAGLVAVMRAEPGLLPVASAADPDVALVDYHLREGDGLLLCRALKSLPAPPRFLSYSAFAEAGLGLPATIAGADGLVDKGTPTEDLFSGFARWRGAAPCCLSAHRP